MFSLSYLSITCIWVTNLREKEGEREREREGERERERERVFVYVLREKEIW